MTAMVSDAEKQRQIDCKLCEESTKCRVEKSKNKIFPYLYVDIDTGGTIEAEEYERRWYRAYANYALQDWDSWLQNQYNLFRA